MHIYHNIIRSAPLSLQFLRNLLIVSLAHMHVMISFRVVLVIFAYNTLLWQIENEYELVEYQIGRPGVAYTKWAAGMAVGLGTGVPWVMCKQGDAPDPIVYVSSTHIYISLL